MTKNKGWERKFIETGADLEHKRWARWQSWCHKVLRENCPSPELEKVLERWDRQIATDYKDLSEKEKESDKEQVREYLPLICQLLADEGMGLVNTTVSSIMKAINQRLKEVIKK